MPTARQAEGVLEQRPDRQERRHVERQPHREGRIAARPAHQLRRKARDAQALHHRIVVAAVDAAVVQQEGVGQAAQPRQGLVIVLGDRLFGQVAAGHHQRATDVAQDQVVQRRVAGSISPTMALRGATSSASDVSGRWSSSTMGRCDGGQRLAPPRHPPAPGRAASIERGHHHRQRLVRAVFARAQRGHRRRIGRVARQMKAAQPLDRHDGALPAAVAGPRAAPPRCRPAPARRPAARRGYPPARGAARTPGRHSVGRESVGRADRRTPRWHSAHSGKALMVVLGRS